MRKIYRKGVVHPSPPAPEGNSDHYLSFLPAAILTLTVGLSPEELEVLSYLITRSFNNKVTKPRKKNAKEGHPSSFSCDCFSCYMSYWAKWDSSSNRDLIHVAIDAFEELSLSTPRRKPSNPARRRKGSAPPTTAVANQREHGHDELKTELGERDSEVEGGGDDVAVVVDIKGPVRRLVSLIGERLFSVYALYRNKNSHHNNRSEDF